MAQSHMYDLLREVSTDLLESAIRTQIGFRWRVPASDEDPNRASLVEASPFVYQGLAGIGLAIAETAAILKDDRLRECAIGAVLEALAALTGALRTSAGLYNGAAGTYLIAHRVGMLLDDATLVDSSFHGIARVDVDASIGLNDIIAGDAGGILAQLYFHRAGDSKALARAQTLGNRLLENAVKLPNGWAWEFDRSNHRFLNGYSHGVSGIGSALLELSAATGEDRFAFAGFSAFQYEDSYFDPVTNNWPDFRDITLYQLLKVPPAALWSRVKRGEPFTERVGAPMLAWCHGAPGIALARVRAFELFHRPQDLLMAQRALGTTIRAVRNFQPANFSLCHGQLGHCETLTITAAISEPGEHDDLVSDVLSRAVDLYRQTGTIYSPEKFDGVPSPGLLTGSAGLLHMTARALGRSEMPVLCINASWNWSFGGEGRSTCLASFSQELSNHFQRERVDYIRESLSVAAGAGLLLPNEADTLRELDDVQRALEVLTEKVVRPSAHRETDECELAVALDAARVRLLTTGLDLSVDVVEVLLQRLAAEQDHLDLAYQRSSRLLLIDAPTHDESTGGPVQYLLERRRGTVTVWPIKGLASACLSVFDGARSLREACAIFLERHDLTADVHARTAFMEQAEIFRSRRWITPCMTGLQRMSMLQHASSSAHLVSR